MCNSYQDLPDAPWIRSAELYGMPEAEEIKYRCPICGAEEPEDFYFDKSGDIIGCCECVERHDAYSWAADHLDRITV